MQPSISTILKETTKLKTVDEKVEWLKKHDSQPLRLVLSYMYDPDKKTTLPKGKPPYKKSDFPDSEGMLYTESRKLRVFYEGNGYDHMKSLKRESLFITLLESIDAGDSELLIDMKDKKRIKGLAVKTINRAFPNLLPEIKK